MKVLYLFFFVGLIQFNNCASKPLSTMNKLNEPFEVRFGKTVTFAEESISITFESVRDSRCPQKTQCIVPGEAKLVFNVLKNEKASVVNLEAKGLCFEQDGSCGTEQKIAGYVVKLIVLNPYPQKSMPDQNKYVAKVVISKE